MALGFMRRHRRWLYGFLWLVIAAFIILYIPAFQDAGAQGAGATLVDVGSLPITVGEYQKAYLRQREMYQSLYQGRLDSEALKRMGLEEQTLQTLIDERVLQLEARRLGISVDDETLRQRLATSPEFQIDGRFMGAEELRRRLEMQGITVNEFEQELRRRLLRERVASLVTDGVMVSPREAEEEFRRRHEQIKAEYVMVPAEVSSVAVTDDEVRARFEAAKDRYAFPERRVLSYLLLDLPKLQPRVSVTEAEERAYYDSHQDEFKQPEQVCASHVLIKVKATPEATEGHPDEEARKLAQSALDQAKAGADFAALAKKMSEDQGSAPQGGDLGCFERGRMVPEFENAAFSMQPGQVSDLVKSQFGFHIIKVVDKKAASTRSLDEVRAQIQATLTTQRVDQQIADRTRDLDTRVTKPSDLDTVGKETGLVVSETGFFARDEPVPGIGPTPEVANQAFQMKDGEVSRALQSPRGPMYITVTGKRDPYVPNLDEVKDRVREDVIKVRAAELSKQKAGEIAAALRASKDFAATAKAQGLEAKDTQLITRGSPLPDVGVSQEIDTAAFTLPTGGVSDPVVTPTATAIVRVAERQEVTPDAFRTAKESFRTQLLNERRAQFFDSYMTKAKQAMKIQVNSDVARRIIGA